MRRYLSIFLFLVTVPVQAEPLEFYLSFDGKTRAEPFTGRVHVLLSKQNASGPPTGPNWFRPQPMLARDVHAWKPGDNLVVGADALAYPQPLAKLEKGTYWALAVMDLDRGHRSFGAAPGNIYSEPKQIELDAATTGPVNLVLDRVVKERPLAETDRVKLVEINSGFLAAFHCQAMKMRAAVVLPKSFNEDPKKRYPVIYEIPGFGGTHGAAFRMVELNPTDIAGVEMLYVVLDPSCSNGHHVFADSANNGP